MPPTSAARAVVSALEPGAALGSALWPTPLDAKRSASSAELRWENFTKADPLCAAAELLSRTSLT